MRKFRLSAEAKEDLIDIADYGDAQYGVERSNAYRDELHKHFLELSKFPLHYQAVDDIRKGYRRSVCGVHTVYYLVENEDIVIVRILGRQDPFRALD